jgi:hypothetical protein
MRLEKKLDHKEQEKRGVRQSRTGLHLISSKTKNRNRTETSRKRREIVSKQLVGTRIKNLQGRRVEPVKAERRKKNGKSGEARKKVKGSKSKKSRVKKKNRTACFKIFQSTVAAKLSMFEINNHSFPSEIYLSNRPDRENDCQMSPWPGGYLTL